MFEIIDINDNRWDEIVKSFPDYDVYYLSGYAVGFERHNDGEPLLLYYDSEDLRAICVVHKRIIDDSDCCDIITPYGYGGFIFDGERSQANMQLFKEAFFSAMNSTNVVSAFFRYNPLLNNADDVRSLFPIIDLGKTIDIPLESTEEIFDNFTSKNRNTIRKAIKNDITISYGKGMELLEKFIPIYNATMDRDNASQYYYFRQEFYQSIDRCLSDNYLIFCAEYEGQIIATSIILFAGHNMHYHLSGSLIEYRHIAPTNLLLYKAALWGFEHGFKRFHLGGGVGAGEDNLFKFKQAFNRFYTNQFSIGKIVFNQSRYDMLVERRLAENPEFNVDSTFFPLYRA